MTGESGECVCALGSLPICRGRRYPDPAAARTGMVAASRPFSATTMLSSQSKAVSMRMSRSTE